MRASWAARALLPEASAQSLTTTWKFPVIYCYIAAKEKPAAWLRSCRKHLLSSLCGTEEVAQVQWLVTVPLSFTRKCMIYLCYFCFMPVFGDELTYESEDVILGTVKIPLIDLIRKRTGMPPSIITSLLKYSDDVVIHLFFWTQRYFWMVWSAPTSGKELFSARA